MQDIFLFSTDNIRINNSNEDITYRGAVYKGDGGFEIVRHIQNTNLQLDECTMKCVYTEHFPTKESAAKLYSVETKIVHISEGHGQIIIEGIAGDIKTATTGFEITIFSNLYKLRQSLAKKYSQMCRASFCDNNCGLNIAEQRHKNIVLHTEGNIVMLQKDVPGKLWGNGILTTSDGGKYPVKNVDGRAVMLFENAAIAKNTKVVITPFCDKTLKTCTECYDNAINFQGEPFIL